MAEQRKLALTRLSPAERAAVKAFLKALNERFQEQVIGIFLFGSKARGDSQTESDIDILVILREEGWQLRNAISTLAARISYEHDVLLGPILIGEKRWGHMQQAKFSLYRNVSRDGLVLQGPRITPLSA